MMAAPSTATVRPYLDRPQEFIRALIEAVVAAAGQGVPAELLEDGAQP